MYKTMEQIHKEYDGQWVFMINCKKGQHNSIIGGEVMYHNESMNAVLRTMKMSKEKGNSTYVRFIGALPEGVAVML